MVNIFKGFKRDDPATFLFCVCAALAVSALLCLLYVGLLLYQGNPAEINIWLMSAAFIGGGPLEMAQAHKAQPASKKRTHFAISAVNTFFAVYFSWSLLGTNPWLVSSVLSLCFFLHAYIEKSLRYAVGDIPESRFKLKPTRAAMLCIAGAGASFAIDQTSLAWLIPAMAGLMVALHGHRMWYGLRTNALSDEQHADIWPPALKKTEYVESVWVNMQCYMLLNHDVPHAALQTTLAKVEVSPLLRYFHTSPAQGVESITRLTQAVQDRLCELDPDAFIVFDMHKDDKRQAAQLLEQMRTSGVIASESLALPDLDFNPHST